MMTLGGEINMFDNDFVGTTYTDQDSVKDGYPQFESSLQAFFDRAISSSKKLFTTDVTGLWELYLGNLPVEAKQHYTCHACRHFIERFGGLVTIDENGSMESAIWDVASTPKFFVPAVSAMKEAVLNSRVNGVFVPDARVLGTPKTGDWTHIHIRLPQDMVNRSVIRTAHQVAAAKREDFNVLSRVSSQHTTENVDQAIELLKFGTVYRGDRYIPAAKWFRNVLETRAALPTSRARENYLWLAALEAPNGFIPSNSSNLGQTLGDIADGLPLVEVGLRLTDRLNPNTFMRAQSAPTANAIREHERVFQKLVEAGVVSEDSLKRRYAQIEEVPLSIWAPNEKVTPKKQPTGVFGNITPKDKKPSTAREMNLPSTVMTWEKFQRTLLPTADKIEALMDNPNRFMAMVTAAVEGSPNILQWDNTFSWYYHAGVDADIRKRVEEAGGRYANNEIRVSLSWENYTDLDIHCITPGRQHIYYGAKRSRCGGWLDVDANGGHAQTMTPVENIRWERNAPEGRYRFYVHNFQERGSGKTPFKVEMEVNGKTWTFNGVSGATGWQVDVFEFDYYNGQVTQIRHAAITSDDSWTAQPNTFAKVNGITTSPNLWGDDPKTQAGSHVFFLLDGVQDTSEGMGRGFFNEMLIPELREIRRTLEAFTASTPIEGVEQASACGLGFSKDGEWNVTLKVTSGNITQLVKIDRWD